MDQYQRTLEELFVRTTQGIKLGLDNTVALLEALGRPDLTTRNIIVAGTNGKGSTSSLLAHSLQQCGYRTGLYTSPHLLRYTERITIGGQEITREKAIELFERIKEVESQCPAPPTFFEATTAMALQAFAEAKVDVAVLEVGLGGRLDSTNAASRIASVITPIALDHCHLLGSDIATIAREKAGIIQPSTPVITATQLPEAMAVIEARCQELDAPLFVAPPPQRAAGGLTINGEPLTEPLAIRGWSRPKFQDQNAATVACAMHVLESTGFDSPPSSLSSAHISWHWPGRFQVLTGAPTVVLDGAHNPAAMKVLKDSMLNFAGNRPVHIVFSALGTKDLSTMLETLTPMAASIRLTPSSVSRSLSASELADLGTGLHVCEGPKSALREARELASGDDGIVLVTGSLFLVADALEELTGALRDPAVAS